MPFNISRPCSTFNFSTLYSRIGSFCFCALTHMLQICVLAWLHWPLLPSQRNWGIIWLPFHKVLCSVMMPKCSLWMYELVSGLVKQLASGQVNALCPLCRWKPKMAFPNHLQPFNGATFALSFVAVRLRGKTLETAGFRWLTIDSHWSQTGLCYCQHCYVLNRLFKVKCSKL